MKIYTRTGDKGKTRLIGGAAVSKSEPRLEAYGTIDELGATLGMALSVLNQEIHPARQMADPLAAIQNSLFFIGSLFACEDPKLASQLPRLDVKAIVELEAQIDAWTSTLPPLKDFILSGGSSASAHLHLARTVCRRAERASVAMMESEVISGELETAYGEALMYLNRLSDYLFTAARFANHLQSVPDVIWKKSGAPL